MVFVQVLLGGQQCVGVIGFDVVVFQCEWNVLQFCIGEQFGVMQYVYQLIVQVGVEFVVLVGEVEVEQVEIVIGMCECDWVGIVQLGVVVLCGDELDVIYVDVVGVQVCVGVGFQVIVGNDDYYWLEMGDGCYQGDVGVFDVVQVVGLVGFGVGLGNQDGGLGFLFGWKVECVVYDFGVMVCWVVGSGRVSGLVVWV